MFRVQLFNSGHGDVSTLVEMHAYAFAIYLFAVMSIMIALDGQGHCAQTLHSATSRAWTSHGKFLDLGFQSTHQDADFLLVCNALHCFCFAIQTLSIFWASIL